MGREYDDGVPIYRQMRRPGRHPTTVPLSLFGGILAVCPWVGWGLALVGTMTPDSQLSPFYLWGGVFLVVSGLAGGAVGWAALGAKRGVAWFRVACVSGILAFFLFVPSCLAIHRLNELTIPQTTDRD